MFTNPTTPNQADYLLFLRGTVNIKATLLPDDADIIVMSLAIAQEIVNDQLACASARMYTLAVYNLATDRLINYAPDEQNQTYFRDLRKDMKINQPSVGVVSASSDESTSTTLLNPEQMKYFTLRDLQMLKTPYGREYLGLAQSVGTLWGLT